MFTFIVRSAGKHVLTTTNGFKAEHYAEKAYTESGSAMMLRLCDGERDRVKRWPL